MKETFIKNFYDIFQLHKVCGNDPQRPNLGYVHFIDGYAYATNAQIAIKAKLSAISNFEPIEIALMNNHTISAKAFASILCYDEVKVTEMGFNVISDCEPVFFGFNQQQEIKFLDIDTVFDTREVNGDAISSLMFNANYVAKLSAAMGTKKLAFDVALSGKKIYVYPADRVEDITGVLMPLHDSTEKKCAEEEVKI